MRGNATKFINKEGIMNTETISFCSVNNKIFEPILQKPRSPHHLHQRKCDDTKELKIYASKCFRKMEKKISRNPF